jgi:cardiolipin synthase A/B
MRSVLAKAQVDDTPIRMNVFAMIGLGLLGLIVLMLAFVGFLYLTRGTPVSSVRTLGEKPPSVGDKSFNESMELLTRTDLQPGHRIEVFTNGDATYPRLWKDIESAQKTLTLQLYYCQPGRMWDEFKTLLLSRAKAGVRILLLHDAIGSSKLKKEQLDELRAGGIEVSVFRPTHWYNLHKAQHRSHIRVVVVDGRTAWTGGFGIDDKWYGDGKHEDQWRDTNFRFTGPAVRQHQAIFITNWAEATGQLLTGDTFFPPADPSTPNDNDGRCAGMLHAAPTIGSTAAERSMAVAIAGACQRLFISNSYFVPDDDFRRMLCDAAERGTDTRILTTGPLTDVKTTYYAGRAHYEELLGSGVRVYEYQPAMMHAKTLVADGLFVSGGTMNFDNRSMAFNDESNVLALDKELAATLEQIFHDDLKYSKEMLLDEFRKRPLKDKLNERLAILLSRML